jgi:hypothetical protein
MMLFSLMKVYQRFRQAYYQASDEQEASVAVLM